MNYYFSENEMLNDMKNVLSLKGETCELDDIENLRKNYIDKIVFTLVLSDDEGLKNKAKLIINSACKIEGIYPASIQNLYEARGRGEFGGLTIPAINIRGLTYDTARALVRAAKKLNCSAFIFEIAKSEIEYTFQRPSEYASVCLAAAFKENFKGAIFLQGDHFQINQKKYKENPEKEVAGIKSLIEEAIKAQFYNIDVDTSTLVELEKSSIEEQQLLNASLSSKLTAFIRTLQPEGIEISVGGEIGEVGGKNSTVEELEAYLNIYYKELEKYSKTLKGISKISVQTGTTHGGIPLPDGTIAKVKLDFDTLYKLSRTAREKFHLAGAVQHGASTLPEEVFDKFPQTETAEIHLATAFQNIVYDSPYFPADLKQRIYNFLKENFSKERKEGETDEQFFYKVRKKGFGPFKKEINTLGVSERENILSELEERFEFLLKKLNVADTSPLVLKYIKKPV